MPKVLIAAAFLLLVACSEMPSRPVNTASPCVAGENSWDCQIERYHNVM